MCQVFVVNHVRVADQLQFIGCYLQFATRKTKLLWLIAILVNWEAIRALQRQIRRELFSKKRWEITFLILFRARIRAMSCCLTSVLSGISFYFKETPRVIKIVKPVKIHLINASFLSSDFQPQCELRASKKQSQIDISLGYTKYIWYRQKIFETAADLNIVPFYWFQSAFCAKSWVAVRWEFSV